jgi:2-phospho-L-lactate guanylyltransferase
MTELAIIIPVKSLPDGKSRLAGTMSGADRHALNLRLLRHTLDQVAGLDGAKVYVVSRAPDVLAEAFQRGFSGCLEPAGGDLNSAVTLGLRHAQAAAATEVMVVPIDLPRLSTDSLASAISEFRARADVMIFADRAGDGTNLLLWRPIETASFHYGIGSATRHQQVALGLGLRVEMRRDPALSFDLDTPQDLADWSESDGYLRSSKRIATA